MAFGDEYSTNFPHWRINASVFSSIPHHHYCCTHHSLFIEFLCSPDTCNFGFMDHSNYRMVRCFVTGYFWSYTRYHGSGTGKRIDPSLRTWLPVDNWYIIMYKCVRGYFEYHSVVLLPPSLSPPLFSVSHIAFCEHWLTALIISIRTRRVVDQLVTYTIGELAF